MKYSWRLCGATFSLGGQDGYLGVWTVRVRVSVTTRGTCTSTVRSSYVMTGTYDVITI
jgi:hypothetical protein